MKINLTLRSDDAEPILREAANDAAKFGAFLDYVTRRTANNPSGGYKYDDERKRWQARFLRAKRIVEAFGIEYEPTSEEETLTVTHRYVGGIRKPMNVAGICFNLVEGSRPDYDNPIPCYRGGAHREACRQAASRVVKRWRETISVIA